MKNFKLDEMEVDPLYVNQLVHMSIETRKRSGAQELNEKRRWSPLY